MSIILKSGTNVRVAEEDITVYKIFEKRVAYKGKEKQCHYKTPFMHRDAGIEPETVIKPEYPVSKEFIETRIDSGITIFQGGFIYAYIDKSQLAKTRHSLNLIRPSSHYFYITVECIIPKGEFYILGDRGDIGASKLIVKKIVENPK